MTFYYSKCKNTQKKWLILTVNICAVIQLSQATLPDLESSANVFCFTIACSIILQAAHRALYCTLQIVAALHDIVSYVLSFAQLGNSCGDSRSLKNMELTADWGGIEGIGNIV